MNEINGDGVISLKVKIWVWGFLYWIWLRDQNTISLKHTSQT